MNDRKCQVGGDLWGATENEIFPLIVLGSHNNKSDAHQTEFLPARGPSEHHVLAEYAKILQKHALIRSGDLVYDLTSISIYSKGLEFAEWGYNRDGESLLQVNLGMLYILNSAWR